MAGATAIFLMCGGFVFLATDPDRSRPIDNLSLTIDLRARRVSGFSKGTIEKTSAQEQIGWIDPECPNISANGVFDRVTGETHAGVCVGDRDKPRLDYYLVTCKPGRQPQPRK
jgi:hypothetical protein